MDGGRYSFASSPKADPKAIVTGGKGSKYRFTVLTDRLLRYEWSDDGQFEDRVSTFAVFRKFDVPDFRVIDTKDSLEIVTQFFHLYYDKKDFTRAGLAVTVFLGNDNTWRYDGQNFGDLGGTARTLDNADGRIPLEPGILAQKPYAVLDDSKSMLFDGKGWLGTRVPNRKDGYVFAYSGDHKAAIKDFYRLSGSQPLLPRWALGNWWSRYHAYSATEYLDLVDHFKSDGIPLTVGVLDMDWHRVEDVPAKYGIGWTGYSWNRKLFPDPDRFLKALHDRGLKIAVNDHPADGIRAFEDLYKDVAKALDFDTSHEDPIRFDCVDKKFLDAYFDVLKYKLEEQGIDFWWVDWQQGTDTTIPGIDPLWVLNHFHYLTSKRNVEVLERPLTFSRYAGPGSHRYPIGFSGDTLITWASLAFQPEFTATASNIGYGGHYWGTRSNELTARWVQLGCFSPILRLHSEKSHWNSKEPWKYERDCYEVMKEFLILRHRLIPFLFTMNVRASYDNEPIVQPMYWNHKDKEASTVPNQYYFGPDLIVAPITSPNSKATLLGGTRAWLPPGRWIDIFTPSMIKVHRPLSKIPVFAKEGTILPLDVSPIASHGVLVVVGADATFDLYEEDESGPSAAGLPKEALVHTSIQWLQSHGVLRISQDTKRSTRKRHWSVRFVGQTSKKSRDMRTEDYSTVLDLGELKSGTSYKYLYQDLQLDVVDIPARLHEMLYRCESNYQVKGIVWELVTEDPSPVHVRMAKLYALDIESDIRDAILEIWFADQRALGKEGAGSRRRDGFTGTPSLNTTPVTRSLFGLRK
ncbi:hypothetical protein CONLIGDRAFT_664269 [Coniochaeta ligniaria NRRL 30616]|uniref:alpha-glucosidase n=1 Tax=Coniochaeta ligniaria NRRL 30616 TaxID=1408157 RepID=A0A1J7J8G8_9PEZI|nr:hypothetical protein CONLIGDRAFT_664269 [Coniochaeta ligniaria NRRL 30616]